MSSGTHRAVLAAVASGLILLISPAAAFTQIVPSDEGAPIPDVENPKLDVVSPDSEVNGGNQSDPVTPGEQPEDTEVAEQRSEATVSQRGWADAATQSRAQKKQEVRASCATKDERPPVSKLLGLPGSVSVSRGPESLPWVAIAVAIAAAIGAAFAAYLRRRRARRGGRQRAKRGVLETAAIIVAMVAGVAGLVAEFVPGASVREPLSREASMVVRQVHPRIRHDDYARKVDKPRREEAADRREVGTVVWIEVRLTGFGGDELMIQRGLYDFDAGLSLLPGTDRAVSVPPSGGELRSAFVPIWIGYPKSERFVAHFRLIDKKQKVLEMTSTGRMKGSNYRYACPDRRAALPGP